jgi:hypothetical protein
MTDRIDFDDALDVNRKGSNDRTKLLQTSQVEKLDDIVGDVAKNSRINIYIEEDTETLWEAYSKTVCNLLELEKYVVELREQASTKFRVLSE